MIRRLLIIVMFQCLVVSAQAQITLGEYVSSVIEYSHALLSAEAMVEGRVA
jgi:hypothetical protein